MGTRTPPQRKPKRTSTRERLEALQDISAELMAQRELKDSLALIVDKAVDLLVSDAASLYLKLNEHELSFEVAVNRSIQFEFKKYLMPSSGRGLAAHVLRTGKPLNIHDVAKIPADAPFRFDDAFDRSTGYRTRSVLAVPLKSSKGDVLGVLQIVNRKDESDRAWPSHDHVALDHMPGFTDDDQRLLMSFGAVASSAIENAKLYAEIENLFEGFVRASVHAIESRDVSTRGHSERVAALTVDLAQRVSDSQDADVREIRYTQSQLAEIRYASLLHDFGKIGVRESTLLKEEKLSQLQRLDIRHRFNDFKAAAEIQVLREYLEHLLAESRAPTELEWRRLERQIRSFGLEIEKYWALVIQLNQPSILDREKHEALDHLGTIECRSCSGHKQHLITKEEKHSLSIKRGSLTDEERLEIESHVLHTVQFLKQIPWTKELSRIPDIAANHHERLNGRGYPYGVSAPQIPEQAKIMAICDVYDALVANDRPYKPAVPEERALEILEMEVKGGLLDPRYLRIFVEAKIYRNPLFLRLNEVKKVA